MEASVSTFLDEWEQCSGDMRTQFLDARVALFSDTLFTAMKRRVTERLWTDADAALRLAHSMRYAAHLTDEPFHHILSLIALGHAYSTGLESYENAVFVYREALSLCRHHGYDVTAIRASTGLIYVLGEVGRHEEAVELGYEMRARAQALREWLLYVQIGNNTAIAYTKQSAYSQALALYDENAAVLHHYLSEHPGFTKHLINLELNRSFLLWRLNRYKEALDVAIMVRDIPELAQDPYRQAKTLECLGLSTLYLGRSSEALANFQRALDIYERTHRRQDIAMVQLYMAKCLIGMQDFAGSERLCDTVISYTETIGLQHERARALMYRAMARRFQHIFEPARADLDTATEIYALLDDRTGLGLVYLEMAELLLQTGRLHEAGIIAIEAQDLFADLHLPVNSARARVLCAESMEQREQFDEARRAFQQVLTVAEGEGLPWLIRRTRYGLARIAVEQDQLHAGIEHIDAAIHAVETMLAGMAFGLRMPYLSGYLDVYSQAVALTLATGEDAVAFRYAERAKSRVFLDMFQDTNRLQVQAHDSADLQTVETLNALRDRWRKLVRAGEYNRNEPALSSPEIRVCEVKIEQLFRDLQVQNAARRDTHPQTLPPLDEIQRLLSPHTRLIEYCVVDDMLWAFVIGPDTISCRELQPLETVSELMSRWRLHCNYASSLGSAMINSHITTTRTLFRRLYQAVFEPLESLCEPAGRLYIVPHSTLYYLPFASLYDVRERRYLVERFAIARLPSASMLPVLACRRYNGTWDERALVIGNSHAGQLPLIRREAEEVQATVRGEMCLEEEATCARLLQQESSRPVVHVAAHGVFRPDAPLFSAIYLDDGPVNTLDLFDATVPTGLLALSACESGSGVAHPGEEVMGLSLACLHAGAQSLLLSLWRIADHSTHQFMVSFYNYLVTGVAPAEALALAQREHLAREEFQHPFYWGAFFVLGDAFLPVLIESQ